MRDKADRRSPESKLQSSLQNKHALSFLLTLITSFKNRITVATRLAQYLGNQILDYSLSVLAH